MPITPRFTWEQDAASLALEIQLPGGRGKHADIYVSDLVIKVNASPYVLLLDLFEIVDESSVVVKSVAATNTLHVSLQKQQASIWPHLTCQEDKKLRRERRDASMERKVQLEISLAAKRKDNRYKEEKHTLRAQMAVDDTKRHMLDDLKAQEKQREEQAMYESFRELNLSKQKELPISTLYNQKCDQGEAKITKRKIFQQSPKPKKQKKKISFAPSVEICDNQQEDALELASDGSFDLSSASSKMLASIQEHNEEEEITEKAPSIAKEWELVEASLHQDELPIKTEEIIVEEELQVPQMHPPRASSKSEIQFTPRVFPTPSRESKAAEEEDWLLKNRKHLKKHKGLNHSATYDISESDPMWLKAKADDFYRSTDFKSAVNAYTEAISLLPVDQTDLIVTCLANKAACLLQLLEFEKCIDDCSEALSHLPDTRETDENPLKHYRLKLKLYVRRGTAHCRLGNYAQTKADYGVALSMDNQNPMLKEDFMEIIAAEKAHDEKEAGDKCARDNELKQAIQHYSESLRLHPHSIACMSNRATCYLMMNDADSCMKDCTRALELLQRDEKEIQQQNAGKLAFFSVGPAAGSTKRRAYVIKTLVRRGTAAISLGQWEQAESDYVASVELDPSNDSLKKDLQTIQLELSKHRATSTDGAQGA